MTSFATEVRTVRMGAFAQSKLRVRAAIVNQGHQVRAMRTTVGLNFVDGAMQTTNAVFVEGEAAATARLI